MAMVRNNSAKAHVYKGIFIGWYFLFVGHQYSLCLSMNSNKIFRSVVAEKKSTLKSPTINMLVHVLCLNLFKAFSNISINILIGHFGDLYIDIIPTFTEWYCTCKPVVCGQKHFDLTLKNETCCIIRLCKVVSNPLHK